MARELGSESGREAAGSPPRWAKAVLKSSEMRLNSDNTSASEAEWLREAAGEAAGGWRGGGGGSSSGSGLGVIRVKLVKGSAVGNGDVKLELIFQLLLRSEINRGFSVWTVCFCEGNSRILLFFVFYIST